MEGIIDTLKEAQDKMLTMSDIKKRIIALQSNHAYKVSELDNILEEYANELGGLIFKLENI